jgi:hypothetical protein
MGIVKYNSAIELQKGIDAYFAYCDSRTKDIVLKNGDSKNIAFPRPYTVLGLCVHLDITRDTLLEYEKQNELSDTVKKAKTKIELNKQEGMLDNTWNTAGVIFDLKHNHGWKDKTEIEHSGGTDNKNENKHVVVFRDFSDNGS